MIATIIISALLVVAFAAAIFNMIKRKKNGSNCSCGCSGCSGESKCH